MTPELIEAAKKEGTVVFYTSMEVQTAEKLGNAFEQYPGVQVQVERNGAERIFQRVAQEYASNIHAVDAIDSSDMTHCSTGRARACSRHTCPPRWQWPADPRDPEGYYATKRVTLSPMGYNTKLVKPTTRRRAMPTCSTPNGTARSSRRIPAIAAPS